MLLGIVIAVVVLLFVADDPLDRSGTLGSKR